MDQDVSARLQAVKDRINNFREMLKSPTRNPDKKNNDRQNYNSRYQSRKHSISPSSSNSRLKSVPNRSDRRHPQQQQRISLFSSDDEYYDNSSDNSKGERKPKIDYCKYQSKSKGSIKYDNQKNSSYSNSSSDDFNFQSRNRNKYQKVDKYKKSRYNSYLSDNEKQSLSDNSESSDSGYNFNISSSTSSSSDEFFSPNKTKKTKSNQHNDKKRRHYYHKDDDDSSSSDIESFLAQLTAKPTKKSTNNPNKSSSYKNFDSDSSDDSIIRKKQKKQKKKSKKQQLPSTANQNFDSESGDDYEFSKSPPSIKNRIIFEDDEDDDDGPNQRIPIKSFEDSKFNENNFKKYQKDSRTLNDNDSPIKNEEEEDDDDDNDDDESNQRMPFKSFEDSKSNENDFGKYQKDSRTLSANDSPIKNDEEDDDSSSSGIESFLVQLTAKQTKKSTNNPNKSSSYKNFDSDSSDDSIIHKKQNKKSKKQQPPSTANRNFDNDGPNQRIPIKSFEDSKFNENNFKKYQKDSRTLNDNDSPIKNEDDDDDDDNDEPNQRMPFKSFEDSKSNENDFGKYQKDSRTLSANDSPLKIDDDDDEDDDFEKYQKVVQKIGEGSTSNTYKVIDTKTGTFLCKKVLKYSSNHDNAYKNVKNMIKEFEVLQKLDHPCICKAIMINYSEKVNDTDIEKNESDTEITTVSLFLEYLDHKLSDVLKSEVNNTLKVRIVVEVAHAMNFLHKKGLVHRDLKIDNIMLNSSYEAKIVDFGLVQIRELFDKDCSFMNESMTKGIGTLAYMSPEMMNELDYDYKTDVYSFGIVLYFIFFRNLPKQNLTDKMNGKSIDFPSSNLISNFGIDLIKKCLEFEPSKRPSFEEILMDIRKNNFLLASDVEQSSICKRDNELKNLMNQNL